ncbi:D-alanyl-D-alanine carboxypeptidase [Ktedonobacteria bacterium brp13]|nr:D-alanyl-D-alanine carboxypeptidase [Ktedonobacteria bacterium brp13]
MRTTPSHDDNNASGDQGEKNLETRTRKQKKINKPAQQDMEQDPFYKDEHPEVPISRRASRYLDDTSDFEITDPSEQRSPTIRRAHFAPSTPSTSSNNSARYESNSTRTSRVQRTQRNAQNPFNASEAPGTSRASYTPGTKKMNELARPNRARFEKLKEAFLTDDALEDHHSQSSRPTTRSETNKDRGSTLRNRRPAAVEEIIFEEDLLNDDIYADEAPQTTTGRQRAIRGTSALPTDRLTKRSGNRDDATHAAPPDSQMTRARLNRPHQQTPLYEPMTARGIQQRIERREHRQQQIMQSKLQQILHNRTILTISGIILVLLIVFTVINISLNNAATPTLPTAGNKNTTSVQPGTFPKLTNPHELVVIPPAGNTHPAPPVLATSAYLLDANTGDTLYAYNPFMHIPMMSTTKLMTALLTIEHIKNLDEPVTINNQIANDLNTQLSPDSSVMGVKKNETYTVRELLYGLFLVSGNDDAIVLADHVSGNVPTFVKLMNQRAQQLGLVDTHYENPHGLLDTNHYSSAHDLAFLASIDFSNPTIVKISSTQEYMITATSKHAAHDLQNGDQFLYWYPGVTAGKTGWDAASNFVQVISCVRGNRHLIGVVMHTDDWWTDMRNLMDYGFNDYTWISPRELNMDGHPVPFAYEWSYFEIDTRDRSIPMGNNGRYYDYTGYSIANPIMAYFDKNKGLQKFGMPISQPATSGASAISQHFQHSSITCDLTSHQCKTA